MKLSNDRVKTENNLNRLRIDILYTTDNNTTHK